MFQHAILATSDLILPIAWYCLHLTNRRYDAPYAFGQLLAALGPRWWVPPLWASFAASLVFSTVYYPTAFAGENAWVQSALVHFLLFFGKSVLLLALYAFLRPAMRPLHGMNGY
ncbi:MAG: hypothetical protein NTX21_11345 [Alphaproteobacteria bacterium]|nr:hypothetical protein [Alphaproteobacteria bacterium]